MINTTALKGLYDMNLLETIEVVAVCVIVGIIGALISIGLFVGIVYGIMRLYWWFTER